ncbi:hypothetical protein GCM10010837_49750 [Aminobacter niigataensis]
MREMAIAAVVQNQRRYIPMCHHLSAIRVDRPIPLFHALKTSRTIHASSSRGNAGRDGDLWGGTGASDHGLTWLMVRGGSVQGFPLGHYGPGALDDALVGAWAKMPDAPEAERTGTEIAGGARVRATSQTIGRHGPAPRFPNSPRQ